ncbi:unnamed protein product [Mycena citricolor]|uniref:Uncharacterized protein n=1 Tax=Mycena citricolor TaxID=2018698 RepID=A0AAD2H4C1_9AGAR|nr:unnamed protein product [Mycena citricolor]
MPAYAALGSSALYTVSNREALPTHFSGAIPVDGSQFSAYPSSFSHQPIQQAAYDRSYSPSGFVQPSLHSQTYGFPGAPQTPSYGTPAPLSRRNSVVFDTTVGPARSNSTSKHTTPYAKPRSRNGSVADTSMLVPKLRRGSKAAGPRLPDGPLDHWRLPQEIYVDPIPPSGDIRYDNVRHAPIMFRTQRAAASGGAPGIRMNDIEGECSSLLEDGQTPVFDPSFSYREIRIRILWPGYPPFEKRVRTQHGAHRTIFALNVCNVVGVFVKSVSGKMFPMQPGYETWKIGSSYIRPQDILITGLEHRGGANYQVEIWLPKHKFAA